VRADLIFQQQRMTNVQMHQHRAEHWIVVSGTALVTKGSETFLLTENQSTYIPACTWATSTPCATGATPKTTNPTATTLP